MTGTSSRRITADSLRRVARSNQDALGAKLATQAIEAGLAANPHDISAALDAARKHVNFGRTAIEESADTLIYTWAVKANQPVLH